MKKLFVCLSMVLCLFVAGVTLSACGSDNVKLSFSADKKSANLVEFVVKQDGKTIEGRGNNYKLEKGLNIRVEIVASKYGVDFTDLVVKVNGKDKSVIENKDYDCSRESEDLVYGNFTLANIDEDLKISVSGVKQGDIKYDFDVEDAEDEDAKLIMQNTFIDIDEDGTFENFYDFVSADESKFERAFSAENFNSFRIRFGNADKGDDIFDVYNSHPFKLRDEKGNEVTASLVLSSNLGYYTVTFPNVKEQNYTIVVNFKDLPYRHYTINAPQENINYTVTATKTITYLDEGIVTVSKSTLRDTLVYDNMKVFLNDLQLELAEGSDLQEDSEVAFVIPSGITPFSTSEFGEINYAVKVEGIAYSDETYSVSVLDDEKSQALNAKLYLLDNEGEKIGEIPQEDGKCSVVKGEKVALVWQYSFDEELNGVISKYNLYDFNIQVGDLHLIEEEETLAEEEGEETPKYETETTVLSLKNKIDFTKTENQTIELSDGYILTAFYDEKRNAYLSFQLEFDCENDKEISFSGFENFTQDLKISYDFQDSRVSGVEFAVLSDDTDWTSLQRNSEVIKTVEAGQTIVFRVSGSTHFVETAFGVEAESGVLKKDKVESYTQSGVLYTEFRYVVSDLQPSQEQSVKFVYLLG